MHVNSPVGMPDNVADKYQRVWQFNTTNFTFIERTNVFFKNSVSFIPGIKNCKELSYIQLLTILH